MNPTARASSIGGCAHPTSALQPALASIALLGCVLACSGPADDASSSEPEARPTEQEGADIEGSDSATGGAGLDDPPGDTAPCARIERASASMEELFEPAWLPNVPLDSVSGVLTLLASTLEDGPEGLELYATICNDSDFPLCGAALQVEFYDQAEQLIGTASGAVQSGQLYSFSQSPTPISCVAPGQTAMAALTSLPEGLALGDLKYLGHRFPAFQIDDAVALPGLALSGAETFDTAAGVGFRGVLSNTSDAAIADPTVSVFPISDVGRPLGVATSMANLEIPPGGTWSFETNVVADWGADQLVFASGNLLSTP